MYVNPILAGALSVVIVEMALLIGVAVFKAYVSKEGHDD